MPIVTAGPGKGGSALTAQQAASLAALQAVEAELVALAADATPLGALADDATPLGALADDAASLAALADNATPLGALVDRGGLYLPVTWGTAQTTGGAFPPGWKGVPKGATSGLSAAQWRTIGASGIALGADKVVSDPYSQTDTAALNYVSTSWDGASIDAVAKFVGIDMAGITATDQYSNGTMYFGLTGLDPDGGTLDGYAHAVVSHYPFAAGDAGAPAWRYGAYYRSYRSSGATDNLGLTASEVIQEGHTPTLALVLLRVVADSDGIRLYYSGTEAAETDGDHVSWTEITSTPLNPFPLHPGGQRLYAGVYSNQDVTAANRAQATLAGVTVLSAS